MTILVFLKIKCNKCPVLLLSVSPVERIRSRNEGQFLLSFQFLLHPFNHLFHIVTLLIYVALFLSCTALHFEYIAPPPLFYKQMLYWWISLFVHRYHSTDPTGSTQFQHGQPEWSRAVADLRQQNGIRTRTVNNCCSSYPISTGGFGCPGVIKSEILCWDVSSRKIPMCVSFRKRYSVFVFLKTMVFDMKIYLFWMEKCYFSSSSVLCPTQHFEDFNTSSACWVIWVFL